MPLHKYPPAIWDTLKLKEGIFVCVPDHYLRLLQDTTKPRPVHWKPHGQKYRLNPKSGQRELVEDADEGLWGGEGWISGFRYANNKSSTRVRKTGKPQLLRDPYSEILDETFSVPVTMRTLDLIDEAYGFVFYILKTPNVDLHSKFRTELKRSMLLCLASKDQSLYPDDPDKREKIYNKYEAFEIPKEAGDLRTAIGNHCCRETECREKRTQHHFIKVFVDELVQEMAAQRLAKDTSFEAKSYRSIH
uniref:Uncharacterized protein n=1 Tax=Leptobrachium leishanense TaxID=445787 RepID=A0A8C5Q502_9ANUR